MKDGLYSITFTTSNGTLGEGTCLVRDGRFVGADFINSYHGTIGFEGEVLKVAMHCHRHSPDVESLLKLPLEFDLQWTGAESPQGFVVETPLPGMSATLRATATIMERGEA